MSAENVRKSERQYIQNVARQFLSKAGVRKLAEDDYDYVIRFHYRIGSKARNFVKAMNDQTLGRITSAVFIHEKETMRDEQSSFSELLVDQEMKWPQLGDFGTSGRALLEKIVECVLVAEAFDYLLKKTEQQLQEVYGT